MKNLGKIDEGKVLKRAGVGVAGLGHLKIQILAVALIFAASMLMGVVANAAEPGKKDVSELTMRFLDGSNGVYAWTGEQIKPSVGFVNANGSSVGQDSLRVTYGNNVEPGKGTITVVGLGDEGTNWQYRWYGTKTFEFEIIKTNFSNNYTPGIYGFYYDDSVLCEDIKNSIKRSINFPNELINAVDKNDLKFKTSDKNIFKINKNKNSITATGVGIAYLDFVIPETNHYNSYNGQMMIVSFPPTPNMASIGFNLRKNTFIYGPESYDSVKKCKNDFKCKVIIATNKNFKKSSIIKSYTLTKKQFIKQKAKSIKSKKFKKGKKFYVKTYTYKKLSDGRTMYGEGFISHYKINNKGELVDLNNGKTTISIDPCIK